MELTTARKRNPHLQKIQGVKEKMTPQEQQSLNDALIAEAKALLAKGDQMIEAETGEVRRQLGDVPELLNMSYIATHYFGRSRTWLYQRINGNKVNGKPAYFTKAERKQLQEALHDIGNKLLAIAV